MVRKRRSTALLLLVMAGLLAYVGYSIVQAQEKEQSPQAAVVRSV